MDNLQSRITPRFLTLFTNGTILEPICIDVGRSLSALEVATRRASVLPSFNCSFFVFVFFVVVFFADHPALYVICAMLNDLDSTIDVA